MSGRCDRIWKTRWDGDDDDDDEHRVSLNRVFFLRSVFTFSSAAGVIARRAIDSPGHSEFTVSFCSRHPILDYFVVSSTISLHSRVCYVHRLFTVVGLLLTVFFTGWIYDGSPCDLKTVCLSA